MRALDTQLSPGHSEAQPTDARLDRCLRYDEVLAFAQGLLSDEDLKAVHDHCDDCLSCQATLEEAVRAIDLDEPPPPEEESRVTMFAPNAVVAARYRIDRFVARGGMGEVYEAFDLQLNERIALKTVGATTCDPARALQYLKREVQLARRVSHRNVCRIFDLNTHTFDNGARVDFLTMEFVDGEPLGKRLRQRGPLSIDEAGAIITELLHGLSAAHAAGILHRDLKSDNVILRRGPKGEHVPVILDFGLARCFEGDPSCQATASAQALIGTLKYMAPEQIEGGPLSPASDLYALGVVWFEMLTGCLPFTGGSAAAAALERLRRPPPAPSTLNPSVPRALDEIVLKCLCRSVEERFSSADEVLTALDRPRSRRAPRSRGRVGAVFVLVAAGIAAWAIHWPSPERRPAERGPPGAEVGATRTPEKASAPTRDWEPPQTVAAAPSEVEVGTTPASPPPVRMSPPGGVVPSVALARLANGANAGLRASEEPHAGLRTREDSTSGRDRLHGPKAAAGAADSGPRPSAVPVASSSNAEPAPPQPSPDWENPWHR